MCQSVFSQRRNVTVMTHFMTFDSYLSTAALLA